MKRGKPNFKTIDLAAPVWVPKVGEMCEAELAGFWVRCKITSSLCGVYGIEYESARTKTLKSATVVRESLREGTAPASKLDQIAVLMKTGKWEEALKMAAKFQDLGDHAKPITQGANALANPDFYRQIKKDPAALVAAGIQALKERYVK